MATDFTFWQTTSQNNKTWDRGIWKKKLEQLRRGKESNNLSVIVRDKHILDMRVGSATYNPTKGTGFFPFEEEISHNIDQALVIGSTGISASFYENPYVRVMFERYGGKHNMYCKKLCRLIRCSNDTLTSEVRKRNAIPHESRNMLINLLIISFSDNFHDHRGLFEVA